MQNYYGSGKLLLSGEYYVLDGALALALPTKHGQRLRVSYAPSEHKVLHWKSYDDKGQLWFEARFDIDSFELLDNYLSQKSLTLQKILRKARQLASGFLKGKEYVLVETFLEFPLLWGLGSSSTLIFNVAKWAGIDPYELLFKTVGGSGYDVACAEATQPILYEKTEGGPQVQIADFNPPFKRNIYFVYLGKKQSSAEGIEHYRALAAGGKADFVAQLTKITQDLLRTQTLAEFDTLIEQHETLIASSLQLTRVKELYFADFWGQVKSLGAWGGDFVLVTSQRSREETRHYFANKGYDVFLSYGEMIKEGTETLAA
ncbi:MAG: GYDIA family GHMP kinase [Bernardetiaceae bacterium]|jgi:mevalonate kinase|nr:GYDIA family GHMP kinase [Bernardetiaceae bacterium]